MKQTKQKYTKNEEMQHVGQVRYAVPITIMSFRALAMAKGNKITLCSKTLGMP